MSIWQLINVDPGYAVASLADDELPIVRQMIVDQYLSGIAAIAPALVSSASELGMKRYHLLPIPFDHGDYWSKPRRVLPATTISRLEQMRFFQQIRSFLPSAMIYADDLMWRIVRPNQPSDVGPIHADKWFWDAGNGSTPQDHERFKIWIAIDTVPGLNGLCLKSCSHVRDDWKRHFEYKHGKMKPVLDENVDSLQMQLLPLRSGEMVLFHDGLLHGGVVNRADTCRVSLEMTVLYPAIEGSRALTHPPVAA